MTWSSNLDEAVAHAVGVGAEVAVHQPQATVRVLPDPAGHPFGRYLGSGGRPVPSRPRGYGEP